MGFNLGINRPLSIKIDRDRCRTANKKPEESAQMNVQKEDDSSFKISKSSFNKEKIVRRPETSKGQRKRGVLNEGEEEVELGQLVPDVKTQ